MRSPQDGSSPAAAGGRESESLRIVIVYFTLFTVYGAVNPYLQLLIRGLGYGPAAVGLFLALFEIVGILGPLVLARQADRMARRRPALFWSTLAILASLPGLVLVRSPWAAAICIAVLAVGVKTLVPVMDAATVAHLAALPRDGKGGRKWSYGSLRSSGSVGFIVTCLALQFVPGAGAGDPATLALCMGSTAVFFAATIFLLPEDKGGAARGKASHGAAIAESSASAQGASVQGKAPRRFDAVFILGLVIIGLNRFALAPISSFISLYATEDLHFKGVGWLWALAATSEIPLMLVSAPIIRKMGSMGAIALSGLGLVLRLATLALFPSAAGIVAAQLLHSVCYGLFQPGAVAFVAERVPPEKQSTGMAVFMGFGVGLPTVLANALGGFVVEAAGYRILFASFIVFALASSGIYLATRKSFGKA